MNGFYSRQGFDTATVQILRRLTASIKFSKTDGVSCVQRWKCILITLLEQELEGKEIYINAVHGRPFVA